LGFWEHPDEILCFEGSEMPVLAKLYGCEIWNKTSNVTPLPNCKGSLWFYKMYVETLGRRKKLLKCEWVTLDRSL